MERLRGIILGAELLASLLFAIFMKFVFDGWIHEAAACIAGVPCDGNGFLIGRICLLYFGITVASLAVRHPSQIGWASLEIILSLAPLFVLVIYIVDWLRGTYAPNAFEWEALTTFVLTEVIDFILLLVIILQLTRRSSIGFGVVDDTGHRA